MMQPWYLFSTLGLPYVIIAIIVMVCTYKTCMQNGQQPKTKEDKISKKWCINETVFHLLCTHLSKYGALFGGIMSVNTIFFF